MGRLGEGGTVVERGPRVLQGMAEVLEGGVWGGSRSSIEGELGGEVKMAAKEAELMMREVAEGNVEE